MTTMKRRVGTWCGVLLAGAVGVASVGACGGKKDDGGAGASAKGGSDKTERPAPFEVKVNKVEQKDSVAPNKTYEEQGLGKKAPAGKVFACVQYAVTNKGDKAETLPSPKLADAKGVEVDVSMTAAGSYMPDDWKADTGLGKIEPGASVKRADCFEVAKDAASGMKLNLVDTGWGPKFPPWHMSTSL